MDNVANSMFFRQLEAVECFLRLRSLTGASLIFHCAVRCFFLFVSLREMLTFACPPARLAASRLKVPAQVAVAPQFELNLNSLR